MGWTASDTRDSIVGAFDRQVAARTDHPALAGGSRPLSYGQLAGLSAGYGLRLDAHAATHADPSPISSEGVAALLLPHGGDQLAVALAALRQRLAIVTLNPSDPPARIAQIRRAVSPRVLVTDTGHRELARAAGFGETEMLVVDPANPPVADSGTTRSAAGREPTGKDLAVLICTSGSTGAPKVVMQTHANMLDNVHRYRIGLGIVAEDRLAWLASLSGGQGLATSFTALLGGGTLCPFPIAERGVTGLADWLEHNAVTVFDTIPSVLRSFAQTLGERRIAGVRLVRLASEGATGADFDTFRRHFPTDAVLASVLASSEAGVIARAMLPASADPPPGRLPVGTALEGLTLRLLDADGEPVAAGADGELVIEGDHLSPGYWNDEAQTRARFELRPDGTRRLRTGDIARRGDDGCLTITGRADHQVKIRGHRLQLEEVEAALLQHPEVTAAVASVQTTERGDNRLIAHVATPGVVPSAASLRQALRATLAPHAIPATFVFCSALPLTPTGKVDRERLPPPPAAESGRSVGPPAAGSRAEIDQILAQLWADTLGCEVSGEDSFLDLGGDSLSAAITAAAIQEVFGLELDMALFTADVTLAQLAEMIEAGQSSSRERHPPPARLEQRVGPLALAQTVFWPDRSLQQTEARHHISVPIQITGPLDVELLSASIDRVVARHEIFSTTYTVAADGERQAVVGDPGAVDLEITDLREHPSAEAAADAILHEQWQRSFDLERGPLLRLKLLRLGHSEHRLIRTSHHIIHDALSWRIFFQELASVHAALAAGREPDLGEAPLQYLDYAIWERDVRTAASAPGRADVDWWARTLTDLPDPPELPFEHPQPDSARTSWIHSWGLPPATGAALDRLGRTAGATYFMTRLALFWALLCLSTDHCDALVGTEVSLRSRPELHHVFGPMLSNVFLRAPFTPTAGFSEWLVTVRRTVIETSRHMNLHWDRLPPELRQRNVRLTRPAVRFAAWTETVPPPLGGLELELLPRPCPLPGWFRLGVNRLHEADRCWVEYDPTRFGRDGVEQFTTDLVALARAVAATPNRPLASLLTVSR
jgi:non-ribosomal peptide synthetase component F/acyl carrier protein